jgi:hypothetical protein
VDLLILYDYLVLRRKRGYSEDVMKKLITTGKKFFKAKLSLLKKYGVFFVPGVFSVLVSLGILIMPEAAVIFGAAFFLFLGIILVYGAYKFLTIKTKVETMTRDLSGQIIIHSMNLQDPLDFDFDDEETAGKKIIYH